MPADEPRAADPVRRRALADRRRRPPHRQDLQSEGLHARAAARFVKTAAQFDGRGRVRKNGTAVSGRSIMGLMMLAAASGTVIEIAASGPDAAAAVEALARLIECKFDERTDEIDATRDAAPPTNSG